MIRLSFNRVLTCFNHQIDDSNYSSMKLMIILHSHFIGFSTSNMSRYDRWWLVDDEFVIVWCWIVVDEQSFLDVITYNHQTFLHNLFPWVFSYAPPDKVSSCNAGMAFVVVFVTCAWFFCIEPTGHQWIATRPSLYFDDCLQGLIYGTRLTGSQWHSALQDIHQLAARYTCDTLW